MEPLDRPTYSPTAAGRLVGLNPDRVNRWLRGYQFTYSVGKNGLIRRSKKNGIVRRKGAAGSSYASFLDLIDLVFVKRFLDAGVSLQKLRKALAEAEAILGGHHFAQRHFFTDGRNIYLQVQNDGDAILELLSNGQWVIAPVIKRISKQIEFHEATGFAERWYPMGRQTPIVVDPHIAFGAPTIVSRGVKTANVYDFFEAEGHDINSVCSWMNLTKREVQSAVEFECQLLAA
jgi:uncharacterized protein (DUF433 family)